MKIAKHESWGPLAILCLVAFVLVAITIAGFLAIVVAGRP